jgi:hypothetical protein
MGGGPSNQLRILEAGGQERGIVSAAANVGTGSRYTWIDNDHLVVGGKLVQVSTGAVVDIGDLNFEWRVPGDAY